VSSVGEIRGVAVGLTIGLEEAEEMESERSGSGMEGVGEGGQGEDEGEGEDRKVILKASEGMAS
jgi:hypothetical protein